MGRTLIVRSSMPSPPNLARMGDEHVWTFRATASGRASPCNRALGTTYTDVRWRIQTSFWPELTRQTPSKSARMIELSILDKDKPAFEMVADSLDPSGK
jgi:hypothetical protein